MILYLLAGFLKKWYSEVENALIAAKRTIKLGDDRVFSFTLEDMQTAFYILGISWLTSLAVFLFEKLFPECTYF